MKFKKKMLLGLLIFLVMGLATSLFIREYQESQEILQENQREEIISQISFDPLDNRSIGYEFLDDNKIVHIWNTQDDYFFNKSSGIQFTNHYQDYWTRNIFCLGYYSGETWNKIKCADELQNFNRKIESDNETFVNATIWKNVILDIEGNNYPFILAVNYYLGLNDENLSITIYGKNIGEKNITNDLGFAWKVTDWDIPSNETDDYLLINKTYYLIKGNHDLIFRNLNETFFKGRDSTYAFGGEFLRVDWNRNLNYLVKMYGNGNQEDFYVALLINAGNFSSGQEKSTTFKWIDALDTGVNVGFVTAAPEDDPTATNLAFDTESWAIKDTSDATATTITEIGWWCDGATEESNFEVAIYTHDAGANEPEDIVHVERTNAKGTGSGWIRVTGLDWTIDPSTIYWIGMQLDDTATTTNLNFGSDTGARIARLTSQTTLPDPWSGSSEFDNNAIGLYAVWTAGVEDSCSPSSPLSANYQYECSDGCNITSEVDAGWYNITINGSGTFLLNNNITNYNKVRIVGEDSSNKCVVTCVGGCFKN